ncbi:hypothetical protein FSP39_006516 [Pinctada imbricata]|uniref:Uncharacterized protein n=1 Tax=Pinctada imbricata TaxID=66713 RepID=A0AA88YB04_PINIB|nr:hypothetical protein FSP39_006516 [Pinctada imbricata]
MTTPTTATFTKTQASRTSDVGNVQTTTQNYNLEGTSTQNVHNHATNMVDNLTFPSELNSVLMSTTTPCSLYLSLCNCTYLNSNDPSFAEKLTKKLLDIKKNLTLPKGILTRQRRRLTSADDNRMSSTYVGLGGIIVLSIVLASLVFPDAINLCSWILDNRAEN